MVETIKLLSKEDLGQKIAAARGKMSQKRICECTELKEGTLKDWEVGKRYPNIEDTAYLCNLFGYDLETFLTVPLEKETARTRPATAVALATGLSREGVNAIMGADRYVTKFVDLLVTKTEITNKIWEYRQCYLQVQRYDYFLENEGLRAVFQEVYALAGVNITDSFEEFKKQLFMKREKPLNLPPDLPQDDESLKTILNAFYAERLMNSREKDIETELFDVLHRFIEKSEEVAEQEIKRQNRNTAAAGIQPYPKEWK